MAELRLHFLGSPRLERDGTELVLTVRRGLALLAYLALTGRPHRRGALAALLWPDADDREARGRLRRTMHVTGEQLGCPPFVAEGDAVGLAPELDLWLDARELERSLTADPETRRRVAELYRGDLLSGLIIPDSLAWEDWLGLERERLRQTAAQLFQLLAAEERHLRHWDAALGHARQWLMLDPLQEPAHRFLMRLYAESGQAAAALRQYRQCVRLLENELDVNPETETTELYEWIRTRRLAPRPPDSGQSPDLAEHGRPVEPASGSAPTHPTAQADMCLNLPASLPLMIGRDAERAELARILEGASILTLTGIGGIGKTRLALELARSAADSAGVAVCVVDLAAQTHPERVTAAVASALGVADATGQPLLRAIIRALQSRRMLLVLDNCEHLIQACAELVDALVRECPRVRVLATSREPLRLAGETVWPVPPLEVPMASPRVRAEELATITSVRLFVNRARMLRPSFTLGDANAYEVAEICRRLDGIPLALELAAARLRVLSPRQVLERLEDRFRLLTGGDRTAPARQQTLEATIEWSHQLLTEPEQVLFRRLAVFTGGWTLDAAEAVCADEALAGNDVLDLLVSLVDKSLVTAEFHHDLPRYRFLDTIRAFALGRLRDSGEESRLRTQHQRWAFDLLREAAYPLWGPNQVEWMARLDLEIDNVRRALDWCAEQPETIRDVLGRGSFTLFRYFDVRGLISEGRQRLGALVEHAPTDAPPTDRGQTIANHAHFLLASGSVDSAVRQVLEAEALVRTGDDPGALVCTLYQVLCVSSLSGDLSLADRLCQEGLMLAETTDNPFGSAPWTYVLGLLAFSRGELEDGAQLLEATRVQMLTFGNVRELSYLLSHLGQAALHRGDLDAAEQQFREALERRYALGDALLVPQTIDFMGWVASARGDAERAARLFGAADAGVEAVGGMLLPLWQADRDRAIAASRGLLGDERFDELVLEGRALTLDQAVRLALA